MQSIFVPLWYFGTFVQNRMRRSLTYEDLASLLGNIERISARLDREYVTYLSLVKLKTNSDLFQRAIFHYLLIYH